MQTKNQEGNIVSGVVGLLNKVRPREPDISCLNATGIPKALSRI